MHSFPTRRSSDMWHKFRNAGQVCISPTRFYVQQGIYDAFVKGFATRTAKVKVGSGLAADTQMGPLANARRIPALEALVADAKAKGARAIAGGEATGDGRAEAQIGRAHV